MKQAIAEGDGTNDFASLDVAGRGIAFHDKPLVKVTSRHYMCSFGLHSLCIRFASGVSIKKLGKICKPVPVEVMIGLTLGQRVS